MLNAKIHWLTGHLDSALIDTALRCLVTQIENSDTAGKTYKFRTGEEDGVSFLELVEE